VCSIYKPPHIEGNYVLGLEKTSILEKQKVSTFAKQAHGIIEKENMSFFASITFKLKSSNDEKMFIKTTH